MHACTFGPLHAVGDTHCCEVAGSVLYDFALTRDARVGLSRGQCSVARGPTVRNRGQHGALWPLDTSMVPAQAEGTRGTQKVGKHMPRVRLGCCSRIAVSVSVVCGQPAGPATICYVIKFHLHVIIFLLSV